jgi:hypothetical protein
MTKASHLSFIRAAVLLLQTSASEDVLTHAQIGGSSSSGKPQGQSKSRMFSLDLCVVFAADIRE